MTTYDSSNPYDAALTFDGDPIVATTAVLPQFSMQATLAGVTSEVPAAVLDQVAFEFSAKSALTFKIAEGTPGYGQVAEYSLMKLFMNGAVVDDGQWTVRAVKKAADDLKKVKEVTAYHRLWDALERTVVMTEPPAAAKRYFYSVKSPGHILNDLLADAKARNVRTIKDLTWTFTGAVDSAGLAWPRVFSIEYRPGTTYDTVFQNWVDRGEIEVRLRGDEIQIFQTDKMGQVSNADLVIGRDITDAPIQSSAESTAGVVVMVGEDDVTTVSENATTIATYGREEIADSQGGTSDLGSLQLVGDVEVQNAAKIRSMRTYGVVMRPGAPSLPLRDYAVSDYVRVSEIVENMLVQSDSYRVRQLVLSFQGGQVYSAALVLNDKFLESEIRMAKKVAGIIGGAVVTGASRTSTPDDLKDKTVPNPPSSPAVTTGVYIDSTGVLRAAATVSYAPPTTNTDGSVLQDVAGYRLAWRYSDEPTTAWRYVASDDTTWYLSPLDPVRSVIVVASTQDTSGHGSAYSPNFVFQTAADTTAPPVPPAPVLTSIQGTVGSAWNGLGAAGEVMPSDFDRLEVATSKVNNFDFGDGILQGSLYGPGDLIFHGYAIGDVVYARFRTVDRSGNRSAQSALAVITVRGISGPDIEANAITANHLSVGSVTAVAIKAGAVTTDKLMLGQTANLVQDPSFNDPGWQARRLSTEFAELPQYWFFIQNSPLGENGALLQALSTAAGVNGGKMFLTDWINVQMGEKYYVGIKDRLGGSPVNTDARLHLGIEVEKVTGEKVTDYLTINPSSSWFRDGYNMPVQADWKRIRYWLRAADLNMGDFLIDDAEVRCMIGTSALTGGRIELTPQGLKMWDNLDQQTVNIDALFGTVTVRGTIQSGFSGKRIEMNPGSTYLPEIRFYPTTGNLFAYINSSDNGAVPFIGMNAPDTGPSSNAVILFDTAMQVGEVNKSTGAMAGAGLRTSGNGTAAVVGFAGKMTGGGDGWDTLASYVFKNLVPSAANSYSVVLTKPPAAVSGQWILLYSVRRNAGQRFTHQMTGATSTTISVSMYVAVSGGVDLPNFTATPFEVHHMWVRSDGDA